MLNGATVINLSYSKDKNGLLVMTVYPHVLTKRIQEFVLNSIETPLSDTLELINIILAKKLH